MRITYFLLCTILFSCTPTQNEGIEYSLGQEIENTILQKSKVKDLKPENLVVVLKQESDTLILSLMDKRKLGSVLKEISISSERYILTNGKKVSILSEEDLLYAKRSFQEEGSIVQPPWSGNDLKLYFDKNKHLIKEIRGQ